MGQLDSIKDLYFKTSKCELSPKIDFIEPNQIDNISIVKSLSELNTSLSPMTSQYTYNLYLVKVNPKSVLRVLNSQTIVEHNKHEYIEQNLLVKDQFISIKHNGAARFSNKDLKYIKNLESLILDIFFETPTLFKLFNNNQIHIITAFYDENMTQMLSPRFILKHIEAAMMKPMQEIELTEQFIANIPGSIIFSPYFKPSCVRVDEVKEDNQSLNLYHIPINKQKKAKSLIEICSMKDYKIWFFTGLEADIFHSCIYCIGFIADILICRSHKLILSSLHFEPYIPNYLVRQALTHPSVGQSLFMPFTVPLGIVSSNLGLHSTSINCLSSSSSYTVNNYDRLEFMGDALLEFHLAISIFYLFGQQYSEGFLTQTRSVHSNNKDALYRFGCHCSIQCKILAHSIHSGNDKKMKGIVADCIESLFGCFCMNFDLIAKSLEFYQKYITVLHSYNLSNAQSFDSSLLERWFRLSEYYLKADVESDQIKELFLMNPRLKTVISKLEQQLCYQIKNPLIFLQAINTCKKFMNHTLGGDGENLEWLGDSILKFCVTFHIFHEDVNRDSGYMSLKRTKFISNGYLKSVSKSLNLPFISKLLGQIEPSGKKIADLVESCIGAIFVDSSLDNCFKFINKFILRLKQNDSESDFCSDDSMSVSSFMDQEEASSKVLPISNVFFTKNPLGLPLCITERKKRIKRAMKASRMYKHCIKLNKSLFGYKKNNPSYDY